MKTFLLVVAGVFVGGILFLVVLWFTIKLLIRWLLKKVAKFVEAIAGGNVPPFRITLDKADDIKWSKAKQIKAVTKAFEGNGYEQIGDFRIPEILPLQLDGIRALMNPSTGTYAVLNSYSSMGVVVDVATFFVGGEHLTVSNAPETGLDRPEFSRMERLVLDLKKKPASAVALHEKMVELLAGRATKPVSAEAFPPEFRKAHAREMDWRVARGGVTAEEVRRVAEVQKQEPPTDEAVEMVRQQWRAAISRHVDELLRERFEQYMTKKSPVEWQEVCDRLYFVHEHSDVEQVIERLSAALPPEEAGTRGAESARGEQGTVEAKLISATVEAVSTNGDADVADLFADEATNGAGGAGALLPIESDVAVAVGDDDEIALDAEVVDDEDSDGDEDEDAELEEEERARAAARARVKAFFQGRDVREAFAEVQEWLVPSWRYRKLIGVKTPYKADVYVEPVGANEY